MSFNVVPGAVVGWRCWLLLLSPSLYVAVVCRCVICVRCCLLVAAVAA